MKIFEVYTNSVSLFIFYICVLIMADEISIVSNATLPSYACGIGFDVFEVGQFS